MPYTSQITEVAVAGRPPLKTTRPITPFLANRLSRLLPQITALNEAHKSQQDAAGALRVQVGSLRGWCKTLGISWNNLKTYRPRAKRVPHA
jgi:hypothetical protein